MDREIVRKRLTKAVGYLIGEGYIDMTYTIKSINEKMNLHIATVSSAFNGNERYLTESFVRKFCTAYDNIISPSWVLDGVGGMLTNSAQGHPEDRNEAIRMLEARISALGETKEQQDKAYDLILSMLDMISKTYDFFNTKID